MVFRRIPMGDFSRRLLLSLTLSSLGQAERQAYLARTPTDKGTDGRRVKQHPRGPAREPNGEHIRQVSPTYTSSLISKTAKGLMALQALGLEALSGCSRASMLARADGTPSGAP